MKKKHHKHKNYSLLIGRIIKIMRQKKHTLILAAAFLLTFALGIFGFNNRNILNYKALTQADSAQAAIVSVLKENKFNASLTATVRGTQISTTNSWIGSFNSRQQSYSVFEFRNIKVPNKELIRDAYLELVSKENTNKTIKSEIFILDGNKIKSANLKEGLSLLNTLNSGIQYETKESWTRNQRIKTPSLLSQVSNLTSGEGKSAYLIVKGSLDNGVGRRNIYGSENGLNAPKLVIVSEEFVENGIPTSTPQPVVITQAPSARPTATQIPVPTAVATQLPTQTPSSTHSHSGGINSMAMGKWIPNPKFDTCTTEFHDSFSVIGPDGKRYPTWHPPTAVDPKTGKTCTFGHEHGRDPKAYQYWDEVKRGFAFDANKDGQISNEEFATAGIPFGYVNEQVDAYFADNPSTTAFMRHEDHVGHKVEYANGEGDIGDGTDPFDRNLTGGVVVPVKNSSEGTKWNASGIRCYHFQKIHQGVSTADATTNNLHELIAHTKCESSRSEFPSSTSLTSAMVSFGAAGEFTRFCNTDRTSIIKTGTNASNQFFPGTRGVGMRNIIDRNCVEQTFLVPDGTFSANSYEIWDAAIKIYTTDGRMLIDNGNGGWEVLDAIRYYYPGAPNNVGYHADLCYETLGNRRMRGGVCDWMTNYGQIKGITWDDPRSGFRGLTRGQYVNPHIVNNSGGPSVWYTDPFGRNARQQPFPGSVRQSIPSVNTRINFDIDPRIILRTHNSGNNSVHGPN